MFKELVPLRHPDLPYTRPQAFSGWSARGCDLVQYHDLSCLEYFERRVRDHCTIFTKGELTQLRTIVRIRSAAL